MIIDENVDIDVPHYKWFFTINFPQHHALNNHPDIFTESHTYKGVRHYDIFWRSMNANVSNISRTGLLKCTVSRQNESIILPHYVQKKHINKILRRLHPNCDDYFVQTVY